MNTVRALEYRITRKLLHDRRDRFLPRLAEGTIKALAAAAVVALVGTYSPELLWAGLAASVVFVLGVA